MADICGNLESPKPNEIVDSVSICVSGWVFSINSKIKHVEIKIDSKKYYTITDIIRKDVVKYYFIYKEKCESSGFSKNILIPKSISKKVINFSVTAVAEDGQVFVLGEFNLNLKKQTNQSLKLYTQLLMNKNNRDIQEVSNKRLKVLAISHNLNFEGAPLVLFNICKYLKNKNYDFVILSLVDGPLRKKYKEIGIECMIYKGNVQNFENYDGYINNLKKIDGDLKLDDFDIIYGNTILNFWTVELGRIFNKPIVWGIHESIVYTKFFETYPSYISERTLDYFKDANKVVFVAKATQNLYEDLDTGNFKIIRNALDLDIINHYKEKNTRSNIREKFNIDEDEIVVTIVGTTCYRKGQKIFLEAANKIINDNIGKKISFYIIGGRESLPYFHQLKKYIKENNMEFYAKLIMECTDVYKYYMISDIFVCASYEESAPMVILEAMAFRVPIVSTNVFGIPEMIRDNREALLIEPGNPNLLAAKIKHLVIDKQLRDNLSHNAYHRFLRNFNIEKFADEYDRCFKEVYFKYKSENIKYST